MYSHVCRHRDASSLELSLRYSASSFKSDSSMEEECDSSSMDGNQGLEPYQYEPSASAESEVNSPDLESSKEDDTERLTSTSWLVCEVISLLQKILRCKCGNCVVMPTVTECVCCSEIDRVVDKMEENTSEIHCIIDHEGFDAVCLNLWVLQTAFHQFRHSHGSQIPAEDDETHRYIIYYIYVPCDLFLGSTDSLLMHN